jgi:hypothetical protein
MVLAPAVGLLLVFNVGFWFNGYLEYLTCLFFFALPKKEPKKSRLILNFYKSKPFLQPRRPGRFHYREMLFGRLPSSHAKRP